MYLKGNQMTSAAEQMAANMSWSAFGKATELRQRIVFALILLNCLSHWHLYSCTWNR